jgi:phenylacetate-CoA ligase
VPFYREKYDMFGIRPEAITDLNDLHSLPLVTKEELTKVSVDKLLSTEYRNGRKASLFSTFSTGTSGRVIQVKADLDAVLRDTLQGIRQFRLQSEGSYTPSHTVCEIGTFPWWFPSVEGSYQKVFVSNLLSRRKILNILQDVRPNIISSYPTTLWQMAASGPLPGNMYLVVTNSEQSASCEREALAKHLGTPVLDEYSSEEATRIALEMPCGHYHVCEDAVYLEVLDPTTLEPQETGKPGLVVVTNLLNEAMPFIRYIQGDYVTLPSTDKPCDISWSQLAAVDGRINDSFVNQHGNTITSGKLLDLSYRWIYECRLEIQEFELIQKGTKSVVVRIVPRTKVWGAMRRKCLDGLTDLLRCCVGHSVDVQMEVVDCLGSGSGKRRPIRREFQ